MQSVYISMKTWFKTISFWTFQIQKFGHVTGKSISSYIYTNIQKDHDRFFFFFVMNIFFSWTGTWKNKGSIYESIWNGFNQHFHYITMTNLRLVSFTSQMFIRQSYILYNKGWYKGSKSLFSLKIVAFSWYFLLKFHFLNISIE